MSGSGVVGNVGTNVNNVHTTGHDAAPAFPGKSSAPQFQTTTNAAVNPFALALSTKDNQNTKKTQEFLNKISELMKSISNNSEQSLNFFNEGDAASCYKLISDSIGSQKTCLKILEKMINKLSVASKDDARSDGEKAKILEILETVKDLHVAVGSYMRNFASQAASINDSDAFNKQADEGGTISENVNKCFNDMKKYFK